MSMTVLVLSKSAIIDVLRDNHLTIDRDPCVTEEYDKSA